MASTEYVLPRGEAEYDRLRAQARMWEPETAALLDRVGLAAGGRCVDVGCGPGETMRLMAERVGADGAVTGIDVDAALGAHAIAALHAAGHRQGTFEALDVVTDDTPPGAPYDVVFARLLLLHVDDPIAVLWRLWDWVAPGGYLVVQDHDLRTGAVVPALDSTDEFLRVALETFRAAGRDLELGLKLPELFARAGIGTPDGLDAAVRLALLPELAPLYEAVYQAVLPAALSLGITTADASDAWFEEFARDTGAGAGDHAALWPLMIGAWRRKRLSP